MADLISLSTAIIADGAIHAIRADVYQERRGHETSLMAKGIFGAAANESRAIADGSGA